jgi:uncharacterized protein Usg
MVDADFEKAVKGYGLTTAHILYRLPEHPDLLQTFIWQFHDVAPSFERLRKFLDFWVREIDGALHRVQIAHKSLITPAEFRQVNGEFVLH